MIKSDLRGNDIISPIKIEIKVLTNNVYWI